MIITLAQNLAVCHKCEHRQTTCAGACLCTIGGRDIIDHAGKGDCPAGFFGEKASTVQISPARPVDARAVGRKVAWSTVRKTWEDAVAFGKSMVSRGLTDKKVDGETRSLRVLSCHGDTANGIKPCPARAYSLNGKFHWCNDCGCGERELARLSAVGSTATDPTFQHDGYDKLDYPWLECPRRRPGFSNAENSP